MSKRILVPVDFSPQQDTVLAVAKSLAAEHDAQLFLLHCVAPIELSVVTVEPIYIPPVVTDKLRGDLIKEVRGKLTDLAVDLDPLPVETHVAHVSAAAGILREAEALHCDWIVMGSHGAGVERFLLGSVAEEVSQSSSCPVIVVREEQPSPWQKVVVGIDFSVHSRPLVELAQSMCPQDGEIHLLSVWQSPHHDAAQWFSGSIADDLGQYLSERNTRHVEHLQQFASDFADDPRFRLHVETGSPASTILSLVEEEKAQAVFVGAHNAEERPRWLGSVSDRVLRHAPITIVYNNQVSIEEAAQAAGAKL